MVFARNLEKRSAVTQIENAFLDQVAKRQTQAAELTPAAKQAIYAAADTYLSGKASKKTYTKVGTELRLEKLRVKADELRSQVPAGATDEIMHACTILQKNLTLAAATQARLETPTADPHKKEEIIEGIMALDAPRAPIQEPPSAETSVADSLHPAFFQSAEHKPAIETLPPQSFTAQAQGDAQVLRL
jgi:hypothetical protein